MAVTTSSVYLDTSALMRMVECDVKLPSNRNRHAGGPVAQLCADQVPTVGLSHLTILEFHDALATNWRMTDPRYKAYDQTWVERSQVRVMELLARQRLVLRSVPGGAHEHAIALITLATRDHKVSLRVWDAIHLITAAAWAHELKASVELWTTDQDSQRFVDLFPEFKRFVHVRNLDC